MTTEKDPLTPTILYSGGELILAFVTAAIAALAVVVSDSLIDLLAISGLAACAIAIALFAKARKSSVALRSLGALLAALVTVSPLMLLSASGEPAQALVPITLALTLAGIMLLAAESAAWTAGAFSPVAGLGIALAATSLVVMIFGNGLGDQWLPIATFVVPIGLFVAVAIAGLLAQRRREMAWLFIGVAIGIGFPIFNLDHPVLIEQFGPIGIVVATATQIAGVYAISRFVASYVKDPPKDEAS